MSIPAALYPFCAELLPVIKNFQRLQSMFELKKLIAPSGLALTGKDAAYSCNHPDIGMLVTDELDVDDSTWEVLLLTRTSDRSICSDDKFERIMANALQNGKKVFFFTNSAKDITTKMHKLIDAYPDAVFIHSGETILPVVMSGNYSNISTPIVLVGGLLTEADVYDVLISLAVNIRKDGMKPMVLANHASSTLLGFHNINFVFEQENLTEAEKILRLNSIIRDLESLEMPDIILLEAPDAVLRYNDFAPNGFGIRSYMYCQAVEPDYFVCCLPCELGVGNFVAAISADFSVRLGMPISAVHVSNLLIDSADLLQTRKVSFAHSSMETVCNQLEIEGASSQIPMFDTIGNGIDGLYAHLLRVISIQNRKGEN